VIEMVTFRPRSGFLRMGIAAALVLAPLPGAPCAPCGSMDGPMDCCDPAPGPAGAPEGCPDGALDSAERAPGAAVLSAPAPVRDLVAGFSWAPRVTLVPGSRALPAVPAPPLSAPHLYLLLTVFLI
jgi:hypothetical protein